MTAPGGDPPAGAGSRGPIYLDYHATTPVDPRVLDAMLPFFTERFGNASSRNHAFGWAAAGAVEQARADVAALIGAHHREIVFTSGATESNNLAIQGLARAAVGRRRHVITVATEHHSVLETCEVLRAEGVAVTVLPVGADGLVDLDRLRAAFTADTLLVSVMAANNEIGVLQPLAAIGRLAREHGALFHTDASQAVARVPFDVQEIGADLASFTAHKMYGPKGVGALFVRRREAAVRLQPLVHGGGQERGLRSGTLNVPGIVGFGRAAAIARAEMGAESQRLRALRDRLWGALQSGIPGIQANGSLEHRLPQNLNVSIGGIESESLAMALDDLAVSSGSACATGKATPSHVLEAIGLDRDLALGSIRFGLGRWTSDAEVEYAARKVTSVVTRLRQMRAELEA